MRTAFIFPGGGSLGAIEVGMLRAIVEEGVQADFIVGTSVGAVNGTYYAAKPTMEGVLELEQIWLKIRKTDVFPFSLYHSALGLFQVKNYLTKPDALHKLVEEHLPIQNSCLYCCSRYKFRGRSCFFKRICSNGYSRFYRYSHDFSYSKI